MLMKRCGRFSQEIRPHEDAIEPGEFDDLGVPKVGLPPLAATLGVDDVDRLILRKFEHHPVSEGIRDLRVVR